MPASRAKTGSPIVYQVKRAIVFVAFVLATIAGSTSYASAQQQRLALVVGQSAYERNPLATAANDAGLIAQTLTSAGFEVIQGRDLNATDLRRVVRDFLDKAQVLEQGAAVVVYLSGYGVQLEGENYLLPVDARIQRDADVPIEGFRVSDLVRSLQQTPAQARIIIGDMGRDYPFPPGGEPIARGLALMEPPSGFLVAFSSAPNTTVQDGQGPYGAYATALAEMMRQPGVPVDEVFNRIRLRTHEATKGVQTPWHASNLGNTPFVFFEPSESAAAPLVREVRRIEDVPAEEAYSIAVERDTIQDYQAFLRRYPNHPLSKRVSALLAARREAIVWRRTVSRNTNEAYWTYLRRYPNGPHAADSRRRLTRLSAPIAPPQVFEEVIYDDLPPPLPAVETIEVVEVVTIIRDAPPPPRAPVYLLPEYEEDVEFVEIIREPPPPPILVGVLPIPAPFPVPRYARPPREYYQPIAPVTPRGVVAIPVARPSVLMDRPGAPRPPRGARPEPLVPRQPGLVAPPQPVPVVARPPAERPAVRPGVPVPQAPAQPRLPPRPIPLSADGAAARPGRGDIQPEAPAPRPSPVLPAPAGAPGRPQPARPSAVPPQSNEAPVARPRPSADENRPAPRPQRPGVDERQPAPRPGRPMIDEGRPAPRPMRPAVEESRPAPRPGRPSVDENRPAPRPMRPGIDEDRARPAPRPAAPRFEAPQMRPAPQPREIAPRPGRDFDARPAPRMERPAPPPMMRQPAPPMARPAPPSPAPAVRPQGPRPGRGDGGRPDCRPGRPCTNEQR